MSTIPLLDLRRDTEELDRELEAAFSRVLKSGRYILGPEVDAFEAECARYLGVSHAIGMSSGTDALLAVLMALSIGPGDEVVCPTYSFFATAGAVARLGAKPVFADVRPGCFNLDPAKLEALLTERTRAIIVVHLFGQCVDMAAIGSIARARGIPVIEDAAQAIGAELGGARAGGLGRAACFSFFPSKNLGALGDAGLVTTNDDELADHVRTLRVHGAATKYFHTEVGGNFRIDELQAALLRVKMKRLEPAIERRREHARGYTEALRARGARLGSCDGAEATDANLVVPVECHGRHVYHQYVVRIPGEGRRDRAQKHLAAHGIGTAVYYPLPLHLQECFAPLGHREGDLPIAERLAKESLALPMFPELRAEERARVVDALLEAP
jgi:dTDP-4-amino-4,6-dideoxygalactose transaminase